MANFYQRPSGRESFVIFGDGDEAVFLTVGQSSQKGFLFWKLRPLPQMRWKKQIFDSEYNPNDKWVDKIYREDLCVPLSLDPDFSLWLILCDYNANEDTPLFNHFVRSKQLMLRNRDLKTENETLRAIVNKMELKARQMAEHPESEERKKLNFTKYVFDLKTQSGAPQQQPMDFYPGQEG